MKTRKTQTSWAYQPQGVLAQSLAKRERERKWEDRRYAFSIFLFAFALTGLLIGAVGGATPNASAQSRDDSWRNWFSNYWGSRDSDRQNTQTQPTTTDRTQTEEQEQAQVQPAPSSPAPEQANPAPAASPVVSAPVFPSIVTPSANASESVIPDTAQEIASMTSAQAAVESKPVTYTSQQISTETRNRLLAVAAIAVASAIVIYILSLFGTSSAPVSKTSPVRIRVPVREV